MNDKLPFNPTTDVDDQSKAHTPDKRRNDQARWKDHDMPDDGDGPKAVPEETSGRILTRQASVEPASSSMRSDHEPCPLARACFHGLWNS